MIEVDIATKVVAPDTAIWVVFPGFRRRFLNIFLGNDAIFLETPGIKLTREVVQSTGAIRQRTRMSLAIANYVRTGGPKPPSRQPTSYADGKLEDGPEKTLASNIKKMFDRMKVGDLVIVPGQTFAPVHFAEIESDFDEADTIQIDRYPNEEIPVRKVRWLNQVPRAAIPYDLQIYLSKPPAAQMVPRTFETEAFFRLAYPSFVLAEKSSVIMEGPRYDGKHPLATHEANILVSYFISAYNAIEQERIGEFASLDVFVAIDKFYDTELVQSFSQNFNSPGQLALLAFSAAMAVFVSAGIAISLKEDATNVQAGISVTNSVSPNDAHIAHDAGVKLQYLFNSLQKKEIEQLRGLAAKSKKNIGLRTPVRVEVKR